MVDQIGAQGREQAYLQKTISGAVTLVPYVAIESMTGITVDITGDHADLDSGAGTDNHEVFAIGVAGSGGHVVITGDAANGLDVDVTRVTGTVTVDSELPAAAALADAATNPTAPAVGTFLHLFNGTTWDRVRGDITNGIDVDVTRVTGTVTVDSELPAAGALADTTTNPTTTSVGAFAHLFNGTTWDRMRGDITNGLDVDVTRVTGTVTVDSELPAAGALADATTNPTTTSVGSFPHVFNGTTWDRARGDTTNGLDVDVTRVTGTVTVDSELPAAGALADTTTNPTTPLVGAALEIFNGTTWDRARGDITNGLDVDVTRLPSTTVAGATVKTFDLDTGAGTDTVPAFGIAVGASGGSVAITGDTTNGLDVDVTRVTGTVTVDSELPAAGALADATTNPSTTVVGSFAHLFNGTTWDRMRGDTTNGLDVDVTRVTGTVTVDSELPAAGALADTTTNPTTTSVGALGLLFNGTTWDRMRGDITNGLDVDVTRVSGTVTVDSELPAAATLADATTNPSTTSVGTFAHFYNGTTWDRMRGDTTNGLDVDVTRVSGTVTVDSELPAAGALADATANPTTTSVGALALLFNGTTWDRMRGDTTNGLDVDVTRLPALVAGSATIGNVGLVASTSGGFSAYRNLDLGDTGAVVKASAGQLDGWYIFNTTGAVIYLKIYNKATAPSSADTPIFTFPIPSTNGANTMSGLGVDFATGIGVRCVTGVADANTTSPAANGCIVNFFYK